jgi:hypothetical protein
MQQQDHPPESCRTPAGTETRAALARLLELLAEKVAEQIVQEQDEAAGGAD